MTEEISNAQVVEKLTGGSRTDQEIAHDGARIVQMQCDKIIKQVLRVKKAAAYFEKHGKESPDDSRAWNALAKAYQALAVDDWYGDWQ
jgi:predicted Zn-dependent protease